MDCREDYYRRYRIWAFCNALWYWKWIRQKKISQEKWLCIKSNKPIISLESPPLDQNLFVFSLNAISSIAVDWKNSINPLSANDELSRHENLTFLWTWTLRLVPNASFSLCSLINCPNVQNVQKEWKSWQLKG